MWGCSENLSASPNQSPLAVVKFTLMFRGPERIVGLTTDPMRN
jgi:hypothetical protein